MLYSVLIPCLAILPLKFTDWFRKLKDHDYSFGFYLWSFPIQQLVVYFERETTPERLSIVALTFTMMAAVFSWTFIEKPSMKLARTRLLRQ
jgi:peptidoglycan/LPS O-acetylase OafA/YrhL